MDISILTPTYNSGVFLPRCLSSVAGQTGRFQHIVVDGASTDGTLEILRAADGTVQWMSEPDVGQSDALVKALGLADGEWIGWLNADEFYLPDAFDNWRRALRDHPDSDVIYGDFLHVDLAGRIQRLVPQHRFSSRILASVCFIPSCTTLIRRSALPSVPWDISCTYMMDWDLFLNLDMSNRRFTYCPKAIAAFTVHSGQVTNQPEAQGEIEFRHIRNKYRMDQRPRHILANRVIAKAAHALLKMLNQSYFRQTRVRSRLRGRSLLWFETDEGSISATELGDI